MAALLKKRALAEYSQNIKVENDDDYYSVKKVKASSRQWNLSSSATAYIGMLSKCKSSNEALQLLLRVSETTSLQATDIPEAVKKLSEHLKVEKESAVRAKILSLYSDFGTIEDVDISMLIDETCEHMQNEESHKVIAQGLTTLLVLGRNIPAHSLKLIQIAKQYLKDTSYIVKCKCLELIGSVLTHQNNKEELVTLVASYIHSEDARLRSVALDTLVVLNNNKHQLDVELYSKAYQALSDDYEIVRLSALNLISVLTCIYSQHLLTVNDEEVRLLDDAFGKVCLMVCDLSTRVRTLAITILGDMKNVSQRYLEQTLDKKLMSNMRLKKSAHERSRDNVTSGEWASGAKWADDAPRELLSSESVSLVATGSCGVLVHALEDEFQEVRIAGVDTLCNLALDNPQFAMLSLDFLVDMFNDEIEEVRLRAIESLCKISSHIVLREDQLETMLGALKDYSLDVREALHKMLSSCRLSNQDCLRMIVDCLLDNLKKYPQDKKSTWRCFQKVGGLHPELTLPLVPELLAIHPFFDTSEPDVEDPAYICVLILMFNAAQNSPTMIALFEEHTIKHYTYLRDTMSTFVPELNLRCKQNVQMLQQVTTETDTKQFLTDLLNKINSTTSVRVRKELMDSAQNDLLRLADCDADISGSAVFIALYNKCELLLQKIVADNFTTQYNIILRLLQNCLKLQHGFANITNQQLSYIKQLKIKCLACLFVKVARSNNSALALCHHFVTTIQDTHIYLVKNNFSPEPWLHNLIQKFSMFDDTKPGFVARILYSHVNTLTLGTPPPVLQYNIGVCKAVITEPSGEAEVAIKFTAGLVAAIPFNADITSLTDPTLLRVRIKYPDQNTVLVLPRKSDLRLDENNDYRLMTNVLLTHQVWTEACYVDISLVLELNFVEGFSSMILPIEIDPYVIDLCKPVKVYVSPKPVKRGI